MSQPGMIVKSASFITSAVKPSQYPTADLPEFAFAGRSNVGKSSLINTLVNRKHLVKTSGRPGRTQLINFFKIDDRLMFVDVPGFGYAKVPAAVKKQWGPMLESYFVNRSNLIAVVLIMDIRRRPGLEEKQMLEWLAHLSLAAILVFTKADKLSKSKQQHQLQLAGRELSVPSDRLILFSAKTRQGRDELWQAINELATVINNI